MTAQNGSGKKEADEPAAGSSDVAPRVRLKHDAPTLAAALGMRAPEFDEAVEFALRCFDEMDVDGAYSEGIERIVNQAELSFPQKAFCLFTFGRVVGEAETKSRAVTAFERLIDSEPGTREVE